MLISDVDAFLDSWPNEEAKGFKYLDYGLFGVEYLVIVKKNDDFYQIDPRSTCKEEDFNKRRMHNLLCREHLILHENGSPWTDFKKLKTGGCTCGSWSLGKDYPHDRICEIYGRYRG